VVTDERVNQLAGKEREAANQVPAGSALKLRRRAQLTRSASTSTGPRTRYSISILATARRPGSQIPES
jgi:hypothetical protein